MTVSSTPDAASQTSPAWVPLEAHLGHLDRVLKHERITRLLLALQRQRESAEDRALDQRM